MVLYGSYKTLIEKYQDEIRGAVEAILEQDEPPLEMEETGEMAASVFRQLLELFHQLFQQKFETESQHFVNLNNKEESTAVEVLRVTAKIYKLDI